MLRFLKGLLLLTFVILLLGVAYQQYGEWRDRKLYPPPGQLVPVGQHSLHIRCIGSGSPLVMLISGSGTPSVTLYATQSEIAKSTRVCSYDRPGLGWSAPASKAMSLDDMTNDFSSLVANQKIDDPIILVPESFGGQIALKFAERYPQKLAGIVFVDSSEPELTSKLAPSTLDAAKRRNFWWQLGWRTGFIRAFMPLGEPEWLSRFPAEAKGQFRAVWARPMDGFSKDWTDVIEKTPESMWPSSTAGKLGDLPIIVLQHGKNSGELSPEFQSGWPAAQKKLAALSVNSRLVTATANGHAIAEENPRLVAKSVAELIDQINNKRENK